MGTRLLAVLPEPATVATCLDAAAAAAGAIADAEVEVLHVAVDPRHLAAPPEEVSYQRLQEVWEGTAGERAAATRAAFDDWSAAHSGSHFTWKQVTSLEAEGIDAEARRFDVLVLARPHDAKGVDALHAALYQAGRPFFLAPRQLPAGRALTDRIVIAWNDSEPCRRAVAGARPWLQAARANVVLLIAEGDGAPADADGDLSGIAYDTVTIGRDTETLGDQIVSEARRLQATLLVLGAHRHNMLVEWLTGRTTDEVLKHDELALFLAH